MPALELDVDLGESVAEDVPQRDQPVVDAHGVDREDEEDDEQDTENGSDDGHNGMH